MHENGRRVVLARPRWPGEPTWFFFLFEFAMLVPVEIRIEQDRCVVISWSDGSVQRVTFKMLRDACPCAHCREQRGKTPDPSSARDNPLRVLSAAEARPLRVAAMHPVGNYAYNIHFTDGHSSGIYTFELLRELEDPTTE